MIEYYRYALKAKNFPMEREGALLRIDGGVADCHPWVELGDLPLKVQLEKLARGETTRLTGQSLFFASLDRRAREEQRSLFEGATIPSSHELLLKISDQIPEGPLLKIKMGKAEELNCLLEQKPFRLRLDFNCKISERDFEHFLEEIKPWHSYIDCIEDPFPYDELKWQRIQDRYGVNLACDAASERAINKPLSANVLVLKPAVQPHLPFKKVPQKLIVTSYLDHPIGQLSAAFIASRLDVDVCGLCSHLVYQTNEFSEQLPQKGPYLTPPSGTGFGYDELLNKLKWKRL